MISDQKLLETFYMAGVVARSLNSSASILRTMQESIPMPSLEEVDGFLERKRPLTLEIFLPSILQVAILGVEEMVSYVRSIDPESVSKIPGLESSSARLDAIKQRLAELEWEPSGSRSHETAG